MGQIPTPLWSRHGYHKLSGEKLPAVRTHKEVVFGGASFLIGECKGEGAYGKVFKAMKSDNKDETIADMDVVVKVEEDCQSVHLLCLSLLFLLFRSRSRRASGSFTSARRSTPGSPPWAPPTTTRLGT